MYENITFDLIMDSLLGTVRTIEPNLDTREGSVIRTALAPAALELANMFAELDETIRDAYADTAVREALVLRARERGLSPYPAKKAIRKGVFSRDIEIGARFSLGDHNYVVTSKIDAEDHAYKLECETAGVAGNIDTGTLLPIDYIENLSSAALSDVLIPGENEEDTEAFRNRYFRSFNSQSFGGNIADYKEKVDALQGVGGVKVYPAKNGAGTVGLTIISSDYGLLSSELIQQVQTAIDPVEMTGEGKGLAPIGHKVTVSGVTEKVISIATTITYASGWSFEEAKTHIENAVDAYFKELSKSWADSETIVVRIAQIETRLLNLDAVLDIAGTTLNGEAVNIQLTADEIPKRGEVNG